VVQITIVQEQPVKYLLTCLVFIISTSAAAQTYTVGVEPDNFQPHFGFDEQGHYSGFARDLLDQFAQYAGITLEYKPLPVADLAPALAKGTIDFKYPDNPKWNHPDSIADKMTYSAPAVEYVDGVLVAPRRKGKGIEHLKRLAVVEGWTPRGYQEKIDTKQILLMKNKSLPDMIREALLKNSDGAYYNVVVALYYINNIRARPSVLVFDPDLPYVRSTYHLSTVKYPELIQQFDSFLTEHKADVEALKDKYQIEAHINSEYFGLEQWKIDYLKRQKAKNAE
jgi:membrane-bound lytic murein transglycosylase MltF